MDVYMNQCLGHFQILAWGRTVGWPDVQFAEIACQRLWLTLWVKDSPRPLLSLDHFTSVVPPGWGESEASLSSLAIMKFQASWLRLWVFFPAPLLCVRFLFHAMNSPRFGELQLPPKLVHNVGIFLFLSHLAKSGSLSSIIGNGQWVFLNGLLSDFGLRQIIGGPDGFL